MKGIIKKTIAGIMAVSLFMAVPVHAEEIELRKMHTTAYCQGTTTATGVPVREGICAVKREWIGKIAVVYANDNGKPGELLGIYECLDTGFGADSDGDGIGSIQEGKVIDVYFSTLERCREWMKLTNGKCFVQLIDAEG